MSDLITERNVERGRAFYEKDLREQLEAGHPGEFAAVDADAREYAIGATELEAIDRLRQRLTHTRPYLVRIGSPTAYKLGGTFSAASE